MEILTIKLYLLPGNMVIHAALKAGLKLFVTRTFADIKTLPLQSSVCPVHRVELTIKLILTLTRKRSMRQQDI